MRTNIVIDEALTSEAFKLTGIKTKRELVEYALKELIINKRKEQKKTIQAAFVELHNLNLDDDPFSEVSRQNRSNSFTDAL